MKGEGDGDSAVMFGALELRLDDVQRRRAASTTGAWMPIHRPPPQPYQGTTCAYSFHYGNMINCLAPFNMLFSF